MRAPDPTPPPDAEQRRLAPPVLVYPPHSLPDPGLAALHAARAGAARVAQLVVPAREGRCWDVAAGQFVRISAIEGPQVGDLNLWARDNPSERFFSGKTRALHGTHVGLGDRLWSSLPHLRAMATITADTLGWYGTDADGARVHDVIGTRCDPYTHHLLTGGSYHNCCHSNLTNALARHLGQPQQAVESLVHDVLNLFMCTGFTADTGQYFMKASPVRPGDYLEFFAEIDLIAGLSACPGGDCSTEHSSDTATCHPLLVEVFQPADVAARTVPGGAGYVWPGSSDS